MGDMGLFFLLFCVCIRSVFLTKFGFVKGPFLKILGMLKQLGTLVLVLLCEYWFSRAARTSTGRVTASLPVLTVSQVGE